MLESEVQKRLVAILRNNGWLVTKINLSSMTGWPDLCCIKRGTTVWVEVKAPEKKPRPLQEFTHKVMREHGATVVVYDGSELPRELQW